MRTHESLREETCGDTPSLVARWQTRLEVRPGYGLCKLRLEFAPWGATSKGWSPHLRGTGILPKPIDSSELIEIVEQNLPSCAEVH